MALILELDLNVVKMYHLTKNECELIQKSCSLNRQDRQTDTHTQRHTDTTKTLAVLHIRGRNYKTFHIASVLLKS